MRTVSWNVHFLGLKGKLTRKEEVTMSGAPVVQARGEGARDLGVTKKGHYVQPPGPVLLQRFLCFAEDRHCLLNSGPPVI